VSSTERERMIDDAMKYLKTDKSLDDYQALSFMRLSKQLSFMTLSNQQLIMKAIVHVMGGISPPSSERTKLIDDMDFMIKSSDRWIKFLEEKIGE
jgi:hypothetical protein